MDTVSHLKSCYEKLNEKHIMKEGDIIIGKNGLQHQFRIAIVVKEHPFTIGITTDYNEMNIVKSNPLLFEPYHEVV